MKTTTATHPVLDRRHLLGLGLLALAGVARPVRAAAPLPAVQVYKNPSCGCCGAWADHMRAAGFPVTLHAVDFPGAIRRQHGLPDRFASCHTALVDGYVVEGHVPAAEVKRLLTSRPRAVGLAVPSMPPSSPGMDVPGRQDPYQVLLVDAQGRETVWANYPQPASPRG
ncbi:DUF411 domain-containing protein [Ideonella sp. B508-1]|uniref:DUF411 domain-containing protein n=1 Tax=Ideonella sp. B508-1 TaxID=137716 RepID=UPI0003487B70|nr:DUF411 domain-containing protein [Ideonella sp. B508-1]